MGQNDPSERTSEKLADEYGVAERTVRRSEEFARVVDVLPEQAKQSVLKGEEKISRSSITTINKMEAPIKKQFIKEVEKGTPIKEAVKKVDPELKRKERDDP